MNCNVRPESIINLNLNIDTLDSPRFSSYMHAHQWGRNARLPRKNDGIVLVTDGEVEYNFPEKTFTASKGDIVKFTHGSCYTGRVLSDGICFSIIDFTTAENDEYNAFPLPTVFHTSDYNLISLQFSEIIEMYQRAHVFTLLQCKSMLYRLLVSLLNDYLKIAFSEKSLPLINDIIDYINIKYADPTFSVSEICGKFYISPSQLRKKFNMFTAMPPNEYIRDVRIRNAKYLLRYSDWSIDDIAASCGFASSCYFCHVFKKAVSVSATKYRSGLE